MVAAGSIEWVSFPPLASLVGLETAPARVSDLLAGRWMAAPAGGPGAAARYVIRWRDAADSGESADDSAPEVEWWPEGSSGSLRNGCGRVALWQDGDGSTVELLPGALERPAGLEPLVEAALGDALAAGGECFLHAAAVELGGRRPLLIGDSGAGKSTLALAAAAYGGRVISDDSLLLGLADGQPLARAARRNAWLRPGSAALLPALRQQGIEAERAADGRFRLDRGRYPEAFRISTLPDCLALLGRDLEGVGVTARSLTQAEALAALLRGTSAVYLTDVRFARRQRLLLTLMTRFAERLPAVELRVGSALLDATEECLAAIADSLP